MNGSRTINSRLPLIFKRSCAICQIIGLVAAVGTAQGFTQDFDASGPGGPRTSQDDPQQEINRLRAIIRELEAELARLRGARAKEEVSDRNTDLIGTWLGTVACGRRQFTITFSVEEQYGRIGKGKWSYSGAARGTDEAQISPLPTQDTLNSYAIVTARADTYDYIVQIDGNTITGKASRQNCQIYLERA
ncbi:hypothetical protein [Shinella sp. HZN7]|jgi:hypothetical protein|uniref:hypothetical protein n=1 Tax=Shinella sp. (strain HZN7) TaxID=879274 RepID=UPI000B1DF765|nr:hypothetical protein [Shinella sp. HZN7]